MRTDHKPLKYLLASPMQNRKVQLQGLSLAGYNCKIEYIEGASNTVVDLFSHSPQGHLVTQDRTEEKEEVGISDKCLEVNSFNLNRFKSYAGWEDKRAGKKEKLESTWNGMDMVEEQIKDYDIWRIKEQLEPGKAKGALNNGTL